MSLGWLTATVTALLLALLVAQLLHSTPPPPPPTPAAPMSAPPAVLPPDIGGDPTAFEARMQIVCLGDSLTQRGSEPAGWVNTLGHYYSRKADVLNRGYSGYNTNHAVALLRQHIKAGIWPTAHAGAPAPAGTRPPAIVTIFFGQELLTNMRGGLCGANDACLPGSISDAQSVPLEQYRSNLVELVTLLKGHRGQLNPDLHLVIVGPPQCDSKAWGLFSQQRHKLPEPPVTRDNEHTRQYSEAARSVAAHFDLPFVHTFSLTSDWGASLVDGLHFTPRANHALFKVLLLVIQKSYPHVAAQRRALDSFPFLEIKDKSREGVVAMFEARDEENQRRKQQEQEQQTSTAAPVQQ